MQFRRTNVRREIEKFHMNMGHLSLAGMVRTLKRAGAKPEVLKFVELLKRQVSQGSLRETLEADEIRVRLQFQQLG